MSVLLHIDASMRQDESVSRAVTATFAAEWRRANPDGHYVYRDLAASPLPHLDQAGFDAATTAEAAHTPAQRAAWTISKPLIEELRAADTVLLGVPMYNFSIPSTVKAWLDRIVVRDHFADPDTGRGMLSGKQVVVVNSRGGGYGPGTPREHLEFQERYLRGLFTHLGLHEHLTFVNAELTLAPVNPAMAELRGLAEESLANAHHTARELAGAQLVVN